MPMNLNRRRNNAFTLLELLIVIGIMAVLITLFTLGYKYVGKNGQTNATIAELNQLKTMQGNYEKVAGTSYAGNNSASVHALPWQAMIVAPASLTDGSTYRHGGAVFLTQVVMQQLLTVSDNQTIIAQLPPAELMQPRFSASDLSAISAWAAGTFYNAGTLVLDPTNDVLVSIQDVPSSGGIGLGNAAYWVEVYNPNAISPNPQYPLTAPVLLDAWNNPILYVPPGGILTTESPQVNTTLWPAWASGTVYSINAQVSDNVSVLGNSVLQDFICVAGGVTAASPHDPPPGNEPPNSSVWRSAYSSPNGRPFWVSAGPDGIVGQVSSSNASPADDNVNSYQN